MLFRGHVRAHPVRVKIAALLAAVVTLLAGCASAKQSPPDRVAPHVSAAGQEEMDELARSAPCDRVNSSNDLAGPGQIADFGVVGVINCRQDLRSYPDEGEWRVLLRQVAPSGLAALVAALERPDESPPPQGVSCPLPAYGPLSILLANNTGGYLHPRMPEDACGAPQRELTQAMDALDWQTVSLTRLDQSRTPESIASGCAMAWKNELEMVAPSLEPSAGGPVFANSARTTRKICIYHAGDDLDRGDFVNAVTLDGEDAHDLDLALAAAAPTGDCQAQREFAVVFGGDHWLNVELGGCWRVLRVDLSYTEFGGADAATVNRLLGTN